MSEFGGAALVNPFSSAVGEVEATEYLEVRPTYPAACYEAIESLADHLGTVVDVGAGTGQFTRGLVGRWQQVVAVEPSRAMRAVLEAQPWSTSVEVVDGTAEQTGLPSRFAEVMVWAQCSHWLDVPIASLEAARVLRPAGLLAVVANQLDVSHPWVHRLSRIMRSGDVVRRDRTPSLGESFEEPELLEIPWVSQLSVAECLALGRTRSSYLAASESGREKLQQNLKWYLLEHLGFSPTAEFELPYTTFVWTARSRNLAANTH